MSGAVSAAVVGAGVSAAVGGGILGAGLGALASGAVGMAVNAIGGGGGAGGGQVTAPVAGGGVGGGGSASGTAPFEGLSAFTTAGVHPSVKPPMGPGDPREANTGINNVSGQIADVKAPSATKIDPLSAVRKTPTQPNFEQNANKDTNDMWADRLSRYLDYNTRTLG